MSGSTGGNMATGDAKDSKDIPPGTKVVCTTCFDEKIEGEVVAFDYGAKLLVISILFALIARFFFWGNALPVAESRGAKNSPKDRELRFLHHNRNVEFTKTGSSILGIFIFLAVSVLFLHVVN